MKDWFEVQLHVQTPGNVQLPAMGYGHIKHEDVVCFYIDPLTPCYITSSSSGSKDTIPGVYMVPDEVGQQEEETYLLFPEYPGFHVFAFWCGRKTISITLSKN